nr:reverse transcriptase domain-containing protein [Tanacetum cinerariifolium]
MKSLPQRTNSRDSPRGKGHTRTLSVSRDDRHKDRECLRGTRESYGDSFSHSYQGTGSRQDNNPELTKRLNEYVPKTMEEMMITTTAFIRGEAATVSKKKGHASWKPQDQPKRHSSDKRFDFRGHPRGKGGLTDLLLLPRRRKKSWLPKQRGREITFPQLTTSNGTEGPLVIEAEMGGHVIHRMYIDGGSSMEILCEHCFNRIRPEIKGQMVPATTSLTGFSGETIWPIGQLKLIVTIGDATHSTKAWMDFMVVKSMSPYNVEGGIATIRNTILIPTECASVTTSSVTPEEMTRPANFTVALHPDFPDQEVINGGSLSDKGRTELCSVLKKNLDIFAWQPSDMTGVPRSVAEHRLNIQEGYTPVRQKKRGQAPERARAIQAEVQKLVDIGIMREVYYHDWLSNLVMTPIKATIKYNWQKQTKKRRLSTQDRECTATLRCLLASKMLVPMDKAFESQVGQNIEVYVDDLVVKSHTEAEIMYLFATFGAVSAVLMTERGTTQMPIYFISRALQGSVLNYSPIEKLVLSLVFAAKRPRRAATKVEHYDGRAQYYIQTKDVASNNEAEYEALVVGLRIAIQTRVKNIQVNVDSKLVANQVLGTYVAKEDNMIKYLEIVKGLVNGFTTFSISQVLVEVLEDKSIMEKEVAVVIQEDGPTWMTQLVDYLKEGPLQADYVMREIHEGSCSMYAGPRSVVAKAIRLGYYWPTMHQDVIDIAGPFSEGPGKVKFLIVAIDYFTKWVEAKAVATITGGQVKKFVWDNIVCRFGIPGKIISDNGKQFADNPFKDWCDKLNITQRFASVKHPQSNSLVERANQSLEEGIKARLGEGNKNWVEELPHVLWAHRTMIKSSHGDTPFSLTYGTEAVIPVEIGMPTYRTAVVDVVNNDKELRLNLDLLEERRERAAMCKVRAKSKMMKYYNARVRGVAFKPGDFVYRSNDASHAVAGGKLEPKWEGPYEVTKALGNRAYKLRCLDGRMLPRT